LTFVCCY